MKYVHELYTYMMHTIHTYILHIHSREGMCWTERKATGLGVEELVMAELQLSDSLARAPTSEDVVALAYGLFLPPSLLFPLALPSSSLHALFLRGLLSL